MRRNRLINQLAFIAAFAVGHIQTANAQLPSGWRAHDLSRPAPKVVDPGKASASAAVPSDAIVLFDGTDLSKWRSADGGKAKWRVADGAMESVAGAGYVYSKQEFGDCQLHVEWASPANVKGNGQGRGNSGVFLMGTFEIQVLDSFKNSTYADGSAGSLYGQYPPLVNASRGPGQWQSYDIIFKAPRFDDAGKVTSPAIATVLHNGVVIHHGSEAFGPTAWIVHDKYPAKKSKGPIGLQDHGNPVRFRNVWIRELVTRQPPKTKYPAERDLDLKAAEKLVGNYEGHKVELKDSKLFITLNFRPQALELVPQENGKFGFRKTAGELSFELGDDGAPKSIKVKLDAAGERTAKRSK